MRLCYPAVIAEATMPVPCHVVKSLEIMLRSGTRRWNLRMYDIQMSYSNSAKGECIVIMETIPCLWDNMYYNITYSGKIWFMPSIHFCCERSTT